MPSLHVNSVAQHAPLYVADHDRIVPAPQEVGSGVSVPFTSLALVKVPENWLDAWPKLPLALTGSGGSYTVRSVEVHDVKLALYRELATPAETTLRLKVPTSLVPQYAPVFSLPEPPNSVLPEPLESEPEHAPSVAHNSIVKNAEFGWKDLSIMTLRIVVRLAQFDNE